MLPFSIASIARVECLVHELDYEVPSSLEAEENPDSLFDELIEYISDDADLTDEVREEMLRRIEILRESVEEAS